MVSAENRRTKPPQRPETEEPRNVDELAEVSVGVAAPKDVGESEPGVREGWGG